MHDITANIPGLRTATRSKRMAQVFARAKADTAPGILAQQIADLFDLGDDRRDLETALLLLHNHAFDAGRSGR